METATTITEASPTLEIRPHIKLTKYSKGWGWEVKVIKETGETDEQMLARLKKINETLESDFYEQT